IKERSFHVSRFLEDFLITMPEAQQKKLKELLNQPAYAENYTPEQLRVELERLLSELETKIGNPTFEARLQKERIDSKSYNSNMNEIAFDLATIFEASAVLDRFI